MKHKQEKQKTVDSQTVSLSTLLSDKYQVDFYQREYVWETKQMQDLIEDLIGEFLRYWDPEDSTSDVIKYGPYYMGEIVLSKTDKADEDYSIIDGQQRMSSLTLVLIYMHHTFGQLDQFPKNDIEKLIYSNHYGTYRFNLHIEERKECINALYKNGKYDPKPNDSVSVNNLVKRYEDISDLWDNRIKEDNIAHFSYWLLNHVLFSRVITNDNQFAYVIFESMNDRGLSLTQVEKLRSYLLACVDKERRDASMKTFDEVIARLSAIRLSSRSKALFEFFKMYFRGHYADGISQGNTESDFVRIGKEFYRWVYDSRDKIGLSDDSTTYIDFINRIEYFSKVYEKIYSLIAQRRSRDFFYLIVNEDYNFTLQPALILSSIQYLDSEDIVDEKIRIVSRQITRMLSWRVWNQNTISQSSLESPIYQLCREIRGIDISSLKTHLTGKNLGINKLTTGPVLNQQNKKKIKVLLALITEIVARNSGESKYILDSQEPCEVEHILPNHYEWYKEEFSNENEFANMRNSIGDLLILTKPFNASYQDDPYEKKVEQYFSQNILAQSLNRQKYENNSRFLEFISKYHLPFSAYDHFGKNEIDSRTNLYRQILLMNWEKE